MSRLFIALFAMFTVSSAPAVADNFKKISDRDTFVSVVQNRALQIPLFGINLRVFEAGQIAGKAAGREVRGNWRWSDDGYFCRDLYWGAQDLGPNCQLVEVSGNTVRFTSDRGAGRNAELRLR